ncbi:glycerophosphodiester phosphodiesterase [Hymenobacter tibetensis]|uniref:Glycerophosphodiester phosphodiesterase n=1 Tax=Hymenobacter tibetensis TaxID=497967 RepID=A0ABY4D172_9BACT|nr:glycerophosphodiester phosphodiesterase family protein [Hymenobacter tibetensis]UOG76051.1 glycerophosphodiester phosphodiesterase [Hymenobacter tibetensis]
MIDLRDQLVTRPRHTSYYWLRYISLLISWPFLLVGCGPSTKPLPMGKQPLVIGHAGSGFLTPINPFNPLPPSSMASIEKALARGADGVEIDIQLSQDSVLMLYHDQTLESMTNGKGCIYEQPAAAIQTLDYKGGWFYDLWHDEHPATLDDLLGKLSKRPTLPYLHFDLHETNVCNTEQPLARAPALARALGKTLKRYAWPPDRLLVLTINQSSLAGLRQELPGIPLGLEITDDFEQQLQAAKAENVQAIIVRKDLITPERTAQAHAAGLQVVTFGGRASGTVQRLIDCQPDAIEVDNVPTMLSLLGRN